MTAEPLIQGQCFPIVFTDLDGTLLDHNSYDYEPALPALARLKELKVPVVLASSKTRAEMAAIQADMQLDAPMICENGGGVHWPAGREPSPRQKDTPVSYHRIRQIVDGLAPHVRRAFSGFGDWSVKRLMNETGLPPEMARLAAQREHSEPGIWTGTDEELDEFMSYLQEHGLQMRRGGRFQTICGPDTKASRLREISDRYRSIISPGEIIHTIALGDAPNDIAMLRAADQGFVIANPDGAGIDRLPGEATGEIKRSSLPGPAGWTQCVTEALDRLGCAGSGNDRLSAT